ncbi:MAG: alpha/beta hydrolase [Acetobacteraceae bacterium]
MRFKTGRPSASAGLYQTASVRRRVGMGERGRFDRGDGAELAWIRAAGRGPTIVFFPGFGSDMRGDKATDLARFCASHGRALLRFDYSGHGESDGAFLDGSIGRWLQDALTAIDQKTEGRLVLVGSSMGGWIALLAAMRRPERVAGLIGIAAAPDFTETLMWHAMTAAEQARLMAEGSLTVENGGDSPLVITRLLIEDGRHHLLLGSEIPISCPVRLLHGQRDGDVPWETALRTAERMAGADVRVTLIKDGEHRLSRPQDLALLRATLTELLGEDGCDQREGSS